MSRSCWRPAVSGRGGVPVCVSGFNHHQIELCGWVIKLVPNWLSLAGTSEELSTTPPFLLLLSKCCGRVWHRNSLQLPPRSPLLNVSYFSKHWITFPSHKLTIIPGLWSQCGLRGLVCNHSMSSRITISVRRSRTDTRTDPHLHTAPFTSSA